MSTPSPSAPRTPAVLTPADSGLSVPARLLVTVLVLLIAGLGFGLLAFGVITGVVMPLITDL